MPDYHQYLMRHGEHGVQDIVEKAERNKGIRADLVPLEDRWNEVMKVPPANDDADTLNNDQVA